MSALSGSYHVLAHSIYRRRLHAALNASRRPALLSIPIPRAFHLLAAPSPPQAHLLVCLRLGPLPQPGPRPPSRCPRLRHRRLPSGKRRGPQALAAPPSPKRLNNTTLPFRGRSRASQKRDPLRKLRRIRQTNRRSPRALPQINLRPLYFPNISPCPDDFSP